MSNVKEQIEILWEEKKPVKKREFYTSQGWEGSKYQATHDKLSLKEIAQRIKKEALTRHPEITLSVKTQHFSGGRSININVMSYPKPHLQKELCVHYRQKFQGLPVEEIPSWAYDINLLPEAKQLLDDIQHIADQYRYDDSDGMIDYFSTNFYCYPEFDHSLRSAEIERIEKGVK